MCIYVLIGLFLPRVALALTWLFRREWVAVIDPWWVGLLGFLFLPFTTLAYVLVHAYSGDVAGLGHMVILIVALLMDVGTWGNSRRRRGGRD